MPESPNHLRVAFLAPANLVGLASAAIAAVVFENPMPVWVALGAEAFYLALVSTVPSLRRALRSGAALKVPRTARLETLLEELSASQREDFAALRALRDRILANYRKLPGGRVFAASSEQRMDSLLENFLRMVSTLNGYRAYLSAADRRAVEDERAQLESELAAEVSERVREVKQKRVEILAKRLERFRQAEESREVVSHQLASIEDLLRLTLEQSISVRDPDFIGHQLDALSAEVQATDETVRELDRFMQAVEVVPHALPDRPTKVREG